MKHTKEWRISQNQEVQKLISEYKVLAIGNLEGFPASLLQKLKKRLEDVTFRVTSKSVLKKVLNAEGHKDVLEKLPNQAILILTNKSAFELYTAIKKSKAKSKARVGMIAPIDFVVPEGDTGLPPGPALSDLKKVGIKAQVKGATIFVPKDTVIAKAGDVVSSDVVSTLSKLDIKPIELILDVPLVKEDNLIYLKDVLDVDSEKVYYDIISAIRAGINLSVELTYPTEETINLIIGMAHLKALALEREVNKE